jgi:hypothetical protein
MHLLDGEVGRHQQLVPPRNAQHRAVIADACHHRLPSAGRAANPFNQILFAKRHDDHYTPLPDTPGRPALAPGSGTPDPLTAVICPVGHRPLPCLGNRPKGRCEVDRGNQVCYLLLAVHSILPDQLLQRESVAAILDFGLPGSVVLERASLLLMRLVESGFRARA